jgi:hypothetical protein
LVSFTRLGGAGVQGASALSVDTVTATSNGSGQITKVLTGGTWQMRWYTDEGLASTLTLGVPSSGGPYDIDDLAVDPATTIPVSGVVWFTTLAGLLAAGAATWQTARTLNSFGSDGIRAGWDRVLLTDGAAAGLADNDDSVLLTDDGLAYAVRTFIAA